MRRSSMVTRTLRFHLIVALLGCEESVATPHDSGAPGDDAGATLDADRDDAGPTLDAGEGDPELVDGASYRFTSTVSIGAPPTVEFLGGRNGVIDSGTVDDVFAREGWAELFRRASDWKWKDDRTRNRSRALRYSGQEQGEIHDNARGTYQYDFGPAGCTEIYVSTNYYWQVATGFNRMQWKMFRYQQQMDGSQPEVVDGHAPSGYWSVMVDQATMPFSQFHTDIGQTAHWPSPDSGAPPQGQWFRLQFYMKVNSPVDAHNGVGRLEITDSSGTQLRLLHFTDVNYRNASDNSNPFRYFIYQNYFGNGDQGDSPGGNIWGDTVLWMDDHYLACSTTGTSALHRVEISDGTSEPVIQRITAASGTSRTIEVNMGHLTCPSENCTLREYDSTNTVVTTVEGLTITR
jgi:hypothetical protein